MNGSCALFPHGPVGDDRPGCGGPLAGLTLTVKDLFDLAGLVTGDGMPAWAEGRAPAGADAPASAAPCAVDTRLVGKTITDELAWSLNGEILHYGTPQGPGAPGRIPGGASAGFDMAVAAGLADIGRGIDNGPPLVRRSFPTGRAAAPPSATGRARPARRSPKSGPRRQPPGGKS